MTAPIPLDNLTGLDAFVRPSDEWRARGVCLVAFCQAKVAPGEPLRPERFGAPSAGEAASSALELAPLADVRLDVPFKPAVDVLVCAQTLAEGARLAVRRGAATEERPVAAPHDAEAAVERARPHQGSYDDAWLATRWPRYPADLDPQAFQSAPPELRFEALRGDEELVLTGARPDGKPWSARLPGLRVRAFLDETLAEGARFREVAVRLDTVRLDADAETAVVVWRAFAELDDGATLQGALLVEEPLDGEPAPLEAHRAAHEARHAAPLPEVAEPVAEAPPANDNTADAPEDEWVAGLGRVRAELAAAGASPALLEAFDRRDFDAFMATLSREQHHDPDAAERLQRESDAELRELLAERGHDPALLDDVGEPVVPPRLDREAVVARHAAGADLAGADLTGLDLGDLDLGGARLAGALLSGAKLARARLEGADLAGATLAGADLAGARLAGARLVGADLAGANLEGADLSGAVLDDAIVRAARLARSTLRGASARRANFTGADLTLATFAEAQLADALFDGCRVERASFYAADLTTAVLERASGEGLDLSSANLTGLRAGEGARLPRVNLERASADESVWAGADLSGSSLALARLRRADLSGADLGGASLRGTDLARANLERARLAGAQAAGARFAWASLAHADLSGADLSGACLYQTETAYSRREGLRLERASLAGSKLAPDAPTLPPEV